MKSKILLSTLVLCFIFCFVVFFQGLKKSNIYIPNTLPEKKLLNFNSNNLYSGMEVSSEDIFTDSQFYILNIWASWCLPCREEHSKLMDLSKNKNLKMIGLNYKDKVGNAKKFINLFGNPYSLIITDKLGIISIELGAYGVPETFIINKDKKIIKKFIGPLNDKSIKEINFILK